MGPVERSGFVERTVIQRRARPLQKIEQLGGGVIEGTGYEQERQSRRDRATWRAQSHDTVRADAHRRKSLGRAGGIRVRQINQIDLVEAWAGDSDGVVGLLEEMFHAETGGILDAADERRRPRETAIAVPVTNARVAGGFVQHEHVGDAVAVEITGGEELGSRFIDERRAQIWGSQQTEYERRCGEHVQHFGWRRKVHRLVGMSTAPASMTSATSRWSFMRTT